MGEQPPSEPSEQPVGQSVETYIEPSPDEGLGPKPVPDKADAIDAAYSEGTIQVMAKAEDEFRTKAVENRDADRESKEFVDKDDELQAVKAELDEQPAISILPSTREHQKQLQEKSTLLKAEVKDARIANNTRKRAARQATQSQFEEDFPLPEDGEPLLSRIFASGAANTRAEYYDTQASRIGDWAALLHDHPLEESFYETHPGVEISPKSLVRMEDDALQARLNIQKYNSSQNNEDITIDVMKVINGSGRRTTVYTRSEDRIIEIEGLLGKADQATSEKWEEITGSVAKAAGAADQFRRELIEEVAVKPLRNRLAMTRNLLNDVRRAVGLEAEATEAESTPQEQPQADEPQTETPSQSLTE